MKRFNKKSACLSICLAVLGSLPVLGATITVTNTSDSGPGSLRDAIASASSGDTINFSLTYPATITLGSTLAIGTSLTISGPGAANLAISGGGAVRVFSIGSCTSVNSVPCSGVTATISGLTIENSSGYYGGGGVYNTGTLNLSNSALSGNSSNTANGGGAIYSYYGVVTVTNSTLSGNSVINAGFGYGGSGGGIFNAFGTLTVNNSTFSGNSASGYSSDGTPVSDGGGISNQSGTLTVTNSTLAGNSATYGGGISNQSGTLTVINSTLTDNSASAGGSVYSTDSTLTVTNSTVSGNSALHGGGIFNVDSALTLKNTLVANTASGGNCYLYKGSVIADRSIFSDGYNLSDDTTCGLKGSGDLNNTPAGLDPSGLQNNGGPTQTIALLPLSPAVDAIPVSPTNYCTLADGVTPVAIDQRGVTRPQGFGCDIGAYEGAYQGNGFSSFTAKLDLPQRGFALNAAFTLSAGSPAINPVTQPVQLRIGPYMVTIPAGSFHQAQGSNPGSWAYTGSIGGVKLSVQIVSMGGGSYQFNATASPVDFSGASNPVTVAIGIGFDAGSTQVFASF